MSKLPRTSAQKIIATLGSLGFVVVRQKGSHIILRCIERGCVVPNHREVAVGTLRGILRQAQVSVPDFLAHFRT